ncbi:MAG: hypothetical protein HQL10_05510 [Nitrospirae bacterium]|nr:hypothetical protein [Nitrospirota bacterium]
MSDNGNTQTMAAEAEVIIKDEPKQQDVSAKATTEALQEPKKDWKKSFGHAVHETGVVAAKTVAGVGVGAVAGVGAVVAIAIAEVTLPALMVLKICSFAGGALGFLKGIDKKQK